MDLLVLEGRRDGAWRRSAALHFPGSCSPVLPVTFSPDFPLFQLQPLQKAPGLGQGIFLWHPPPGQLNPSPSPATGPRAQLLGGIHRGKALPINPKPGPGLSAQREPAPDRSAAAGGPQDAPHQRVPNTATATPAPSARRHVPAPSGAAPRCQARRAPFRGGPVPRYLML